MFASQRHDTLGLAALVAVAMVLLGYVAATGFLVKVYSDGATTTQPRDTCELVCRQPAATGIKG